MQLVHELELHCTIILLTKSLLPGGHNYTYTTNERSFSPPRNRGIPLATRRPLASKLPDVRLYHAHYINRLAGIDSRRRSRAEDRDEMKTGDSLCSHTRRTNERTNCTATSELLLLLRGTAVVHCRNRAQTHV